MRLTNILVPAVLLEQALNYIEDSLREAGTNPSEDKTYTALKSILDTAKSVFDD